jgi:hypothetical protein
MTVREGVRSLRKKEYRGDQSDCSPVMPSLTCKLPLRRSEAAFTARKLSTLRFTFRLWLLKSLMESMTAFQPKPAALTGTARPGSREVLSLTRGKLL